MRVAVVVPAWKAAGTLASAVASALAQEAPFGVGVAIVDDGCPDPETARIGLNLRDANPDLVDFTRQPNAGVSAARNAGVRRAVKRWPEVEAFFFLDADNLLSPQTLALLWQVLDEDPELAWASPELEMFGISGGAWNVRGRHLTYRQLFANQADTGTLVRRTVFEAGIAFDETMRDGYEDWEFFLRAGLAGFAGVGAGSCGFRYRRVPGSMLAEARQKGEELEGEIRRRHEDAYRAGSLARREHAEAPRFALVRCDRADALLLAAADLEPRRVPLTALCGESPAAGAIVLTTSTAVERLRDLGLLAGVLLRLQLELHGNQAVALDAGAEQIAVATTPAVLPGLRWPDGKLRIAHRVELAGEGAWVPPPALDEGLDDVLDCLCAIPDRPTHDGDVALHWRFFQYRHFDRLETTVPWAGGGPTLVALAKAADGETWDALVGRVADARAGEPELATHLILTEAPMNADFPPDGFDTWTCLGGADPEAAALLIDQLRSGADLVEDATGAGRPKRVAA